MGGVLLSPPSQSKVQPTLTPPEAPQGTGFLLSGPVFAEPLLGHDLFMGPEGARRAGSLWVRLSAHLPGPHLCLPSDFWSLSLHAVLSDSRHLYFHPLVDCQAAESEGSATLVALESLCRPTHSFPIWERG